MKNLFSDFSVCMWEILEMAMNSETVDFYLQVILP